MDKEYFTSYISGACNSTPHAVAWGSNNSIIYGSCNAVNLYDPQQCVVTQTLTHHNGRVNSLRWIKFKSEPENEFISSSSDKTAALWKLNRTGGFTVTAALKGHNDVITCADAIYPNFLEWGNDAKTLLAATASADSTVILWKRNQKETTCGKAGLICLKTGLCLTLRLFIVGGQSLLLAVSNDDSCIHLYSLSFKDVCEVVYKKVFVLAGHTDWVRSMDFITVTGTNLLATASQDTTIRLWRFKPHREVIDNQVVKTEGKVLKTETLDGSYMKWCVSLESVLSGHEGWVYGVHWLQVDPFTPASTGFNPMNLRLLSASLDKSMILWAPSESDVWLEDVRVGEVGGNTLGFYGCQISPDGESILAHGYNGSFHLWHKTVDGGLWHTGVTVGGHFDEVTDLGWDPEGQYLMSVSADQTTRLHAPWAQTEDVLSQQVVFEIWDRAGMARRIFTKLKWAPAGEKETEMQLCIKSGGSACSKISENGPLKADPKDPFLAQLANFGIKSLVLLRNSPKPVKCDVVKAWVTFYAGIQAVFLVHLKFPTTVQWHEVARPQVHGYNLQCLAILSRYRFASGAEEKVIRAFQAPANFVDNFCRLCGVKDGEAENDEKTPRAKGAAVPSLGLSNKAVYQSESAVDSSNVNEDDDQTPFKAVILDEPPTEEHLVQNSLWPEMQKLYGHGYELFSLAASHDGHVLASACRATSQQHAAIILWNTKSWVQIQTLMSHQLTVTQMAFSPDDRYLLSVSRDRRWSLFESAKSDGRPQYNLVASTNKTNGLHTRVIWCCSWTHDSKYFATGSREGKIVVWGTDNLLTSGADAVLGRWQPNDPFLVDHDCVTSVSFASCFVGNEERYLMAAGFESGHIQLLWWRLQENRSSWTKIITLEKNQAHHLCVKRLAFRPVLGVAGCPQSSSSFIQLASCGEDHTLKVHSFNMEKLSKSGCGLNASKSDRSADEKDKQCEILTNHVKPDCKPSDSAAESFKVGGNAVDNVKPDSSAEGNLKLDDSADCNVKPDDSAVDHVKPEDSAVDHVKPEDSAEDHVKPDDSAGGNDKLGYSAVQ